MRRYRGSIFAGMLFGLFLGAIPDRPAHGADIDYDRCVQLVARKPDDRIQACDKFLSAAASVADWSRVRLALIRRGTAYFVKREFQRAFADYNAVLAKDPLDGEVLFVRGWALVRIGNPGHGQSDLARALGDLDAVNAYLRLAEFHFLSGDPDGEHLYRLEAIERFGHLEDFKLAQVNRVIALGSKDIGLIGWRAWYFQKQGKFALAIQDHSRVLTLDRTASSYRARAEALMLNEDYRLAVQDYNAAWALEPKPWNLGYRGDAYAGMGDYRRAIADYTEAIRLYSVDEPEHYNVMFYYRARGEAWRKLGQAAKAAADEARAIRMGIDEPKR